MVTKRQIKNYVETMAEEFLPEKVILFGSYANGKPTEDSDVDLLVVMRHRKRNVEQAIEIDRQIKRKFPLDLLVKTPAEVRKRIAMNDAFLISVLRKGKVIYERSRSRMD